MCGAVAVGLLTAIAAASVAQTPDEKKNDSKEIHAGYRKTTYSYKTADGAERARTLHVWYPTATEAKKHIYWMQTGLAAADAAVLDKKNPVILFSHGFLGAGDQVIFLTEELARKGYIVAAPNHADSLAEARIGGAKKTAATAGPPNFADGKSWTDAKFRDRKDDISALCDYLLAESKRDGSPWLGRVDSKAIAAMGHSLGGYTSLGLAGAWETWRDDRIKAALLLSPYTLPHLVAGREKNLAGVKIPVMLQGGTRDWGITPFLPKVYEGLGGPKYSLVLKNENHFGWTNLSSLGKTTVEAIKDGNAQLMTDYSVAFFDRHVSQLRGKGGDMLDEKEPRLESYIFKK